MLVLLIVNLFNNRIIFIDKATPATLVEFKDAVSSSILSIEPSWSIEFRTYRSQIKKRITATNTEEENRHKVLYSISFLQQQRSVLLKNGIGIVTTTKIDDNSRKLIDSSSSVWYPDSMDTIISNKLSNMWVQRQLVKGDAGESFITRDGLLIKCCNLFSSFGFKGLIIELREQDKDDDENNNNTNNNSCHGENFNICVKSIIDLLESIGITNYKTSNEVLRRDETTTSQPENENTHLCDLAYQYVTVLD